MGSAFAGYPDSAQRAPALSGLILRMVVIVFASGRGPGRVLPAMRISGTKLTTISGAPQRGFSGGKQKRGPGNCQNGAPEVRGGDFLRGPACPEANTRW